MLRLFPLLGAIVCCVSLALSDVPSAVAADPSPPSGIDAATLDRTCNACDDFYQFANGGWIAHHDIPATASSVSAFGVLADRNLEGLHGILDDLERHPPETGDRRKLADFYASCMDTAAIDAAGVTSITPMLDSVSAMSDVSALAPVLAMLHLGGVNAFFAFSGGADVHDARMTIAQLRQGGLSLPDRDYYSASDAKSLGIRNAFFAHVTKMMTLLGDSPDAAASEANTVLRIETALAAGQLSRVALRDPAASDHKTTFAQLQALAPHFDWASYYNGLDVATSATLNVGQPTYFTALSDQLAALPLADLKTELRWQIVHTFAARLPKAFDDENFAFYSTKLSGIPQQDERWKRCVRSTDQTLGETLGQLFVEKAFPPDAKAQALEMVQNIKSTLRDDFASLDWMSPETRVKAVAKLDAYGLKIGSPEKPRDYGKLAITRDEYAQNILASSIFRSQDALAHIGKPVDRTRWGMTAPTVNAYYSPTGNEIVFPAGILQPPFYFAGADMAVNYGAIGAVIGHESTHGFDDSGRQFGPDGNLSALWTADDVVKFTSRAECVVKQFDALSPAPGINESGKLVEGEEIADLGGLTIAYKAFEKYQATRPRLTLDGFTPEQRFFLGWAHVWASNERPEEVALRAKTDVHAYPKFRVNATIANLPGFAFAFFCKQTAAMTRPPADRCEIW